MDPYNLLNQPFAQQNKIINTVGFGLSKKNTFVFELGSQAIQGALCSSNLRNPINKNLLSLVIIQTSTAIPLLRETTISTGNSSPSKFFAPPIAMSPTPKSGALGPSRTTLRFASLASSPAKSRVKEEPWKCTSLKGLHPIKQRRVTTCSRTSQKEVNGPLRSGDSNRLVLKTLRLSSQWSVSFRSKKRNRPI